MGRIFAAADIGSNTAHLLIATPHAKKGLKRLINQSDWLSLGEAVSREGRIPPDLELALLESLTRFKALSESAAAESIYVFATEAMRKAANCDEVIKRVKAEVGLDVDLITPEREAELGLRGAQIDTKESVDTLMVETGGGSVQAAWVVKGVLREDVSLPIGTGALIAACGLEHPTPRPKLRELEDIIQLAVRDLDFGRHPSHMVAVGGVARGVWRAMHPDKERTLHLREMKFLAWDVARLDLNAICKRYGVKIKRAETLLPGAMVYAALMEKFGREELEVSLFGVREGAILEMAQWIP
jgi:exopolyphosphatase/guanosine-5'-triphosphate,3'-diphosphate pyrophosphatase